MSTPIIASQRLTLLPTPFDAKRCNYYISGSNVVIETIAEYLLRVNQDIRDNNIISMYIPKVGYNAGTFPVASLDSVLANFDLRYYIFSEGLQDGDLKELFFINSGGYKEVSSNYTVLITDETINCISGTFNLSLLSSVSISGKPFNIKNSGTGIVTVLPNGVETIDGYSSINLKSKENLQIKSRGSLGWIII